MAQAKLKYHYWRCPFTYSVRRRKGGALAGASPVVQDLSRRPPPVDTGRAVKSVSKAGAIRSEDSVRRGV